MDGSTWRELLALGSRFLWVLAAFWNVFLPSVEASLYLKNGAAGRKRADVPKSKQHQYLTGPALSTKNPEMYRTGMDGSSKGMFEAWFLGVEALFVPLLDGRGHSVAKAQTNAGSIPGWVVNPPRRCGSCLTACWTLCRWNHTTGCSERSRPNRINPVCRRGRR